MSDEMEKGTQPLEEVMIRLNLKNSDLVEKSTEQLTHKMVAKGRSGRRLTLNAQMKILKALNAAQLALKPSGFSTLGRPREGLHFAEKSYVLADLFNYKGKEH